MKSIFVGLLNTLKIGHQFENKNINQIVQKFTELADSPELMRDMQKNVLKYRNQFSRQESAKIFCQEISKLN